MNRPTPAEIDEALRAHAIPIPEGYTLMGLAFSNADGQPTLYVAGEGLPSMVWEHNPARWKRVAEAQLHG